MSTAQADATHKVGKAFYSNQGQSKSLSKAGSRADHRPGQSISKVTTEPEPGEPEKHCLHWGWDKHSCGTPEEILNKLMGKLLLAESITDKKSRTK